MGNTIESSPKNTVVYKHERKIIGFVSYGKSQDEDATETVGEIRAIYLLKKYWSQRIGYRLLIHFLSTLKKSGYRQVTLWVLDRNRKAIKFYQKAEFFLMVFEGKHKVDDRSGIPLNEVRMIK